MTQRKENARKTAQRGENKCRIGAISRVDFPSDGFRRALLVEAGVRFCESGVHFVVIAGGLIDGKYVEDKAKGLKRHIAARRNEQKALMKKLAPPRGKKKDEIPAVPGKEAGEIQERIAQLEAEIVRFQKYLDELSPERMAKRLDELLPRFASADGQPLKVHIFPSPVFDKKVGERVAHLLAEIRGPNLVRVYSAGGARLHISQAGKEVDVLVPRKTSFRGDYYSTPADRLLKDRLHQSSRDLPDLFIFGGFGSAILKPRGHFKRPYVTIPALHRLQEVNTSENQIGVRIITVHRDSCEPEVITFPFKDFANDEYGFIKLPRDLADHVRRILETIQQNGSMTTGDIADRTGLKRETVAKELEKLRVGNLSEDRNWPGVRLDPLSMQWDFDKYWMRDHLNYHLKGKTGRIDRIVAFGCLHAGSIYSDIPFFLEEMPKAILEKDADFLIGAGDFVEGYKYRDELFGAINVDEQQELAAGCLTQVMLEPFGVRLDNALKTAGAAPTPADTLKLVNRCLITAVLKAGNHDEFTLKEGHAPLLTMKLFMVRHLYRGVVEALDKRKLPYDTLHLLNAVEAKVIEPPLGEFVLPSGLRMTIMHPHMGGAQTTSLRAQQALEKSADSQVVIEANFHTGCVTEQWEPELGQRVGLQIGTIKRRSGFEDNKMKRVDTHFACLELESVDGRATRVETSFRSRPEDSRSVLDNRQVFLRIAEIVGLKVK